MATMRTLLTGALRLINVVQANEEPTADDMDISLQSFNGLLDSMANDLLNIFTFTPYRFLLASGQRDYLVGPALDSAGNPTGADWVTTRPMRIEQAKLILYPTVAYGEAGSNYNYCVTLTCRNGYDGDVGVAGYIGSTPPFQVVQTPQGQLDIADPLWLTTGGYSSSFFMGSGATTLAVPDVVPMEVGETRTFGNSEYGFFQFDYWFPCREGDQLWVTSSTFSGQTPWNVVVTVGPDADNGEQYTLTSGGDSPYTQELSVTRNANIGTRAAPVITTAGVTIGVNQGSIVLPIGSLSDEDYSSISMRALQSTWPTNFYDSGSYPTRKLSFWPVPQQQYAVELWMWEPLATKDSLDEQLNLPPGYERYLRYKMAIELAPEFGKEVGPAVRASCEEAEAGIKRMNQRIPRVFNSVSASQLYAGQRGYFVSNTVIPTSALPRQW